jgi:hypothetical protein
MALISLKGLGRISGRVGNVVFRNMNGKTYVSARPSSFKSPNTREAVGRRERFRTTALLSRCVVKEEFMKELWSKAKFKMRPYNAAFKYLYENVADEGVTEFSMFPSMGFNINLITDENSRDRLKVRVKIKENSGPGFEGKSQMYVKMITIFDCRDEYEGKSIFFNNVSDLKEVKIEEEMEFEIRYNLNETKMDKIDCQKMGRCEMKQIFVGFALFGENNEFIANSWTYCLKRG